MFFFLSKFLPEFVYPVGLTTILIIVAIFLARRRRLQIALLVTAAGLLIVFGNGWVAGRLARSLEWRYLPPAELPAADAIVLLGGGVRAAQYPRQSTEMNEGADRMMHAARLYREGKAPLILVSGGKIELLGSSIAEADGMREILEFFGVPPEAILEEDRSRNTYENAVYTRELLEPRGIKRILLVTSALHMPRSVAIFEKQGFEVIPAPVDYLATVGGSEDGSQFRLIHFVPSAEYLDLSTRVLREYLGMLIYRLRGWL